MKKSIAKSQLRDYFKTNYNLDIVWLEQINGVGCDKSKSYFGVLITPGTQHCYNFNYFPAVSSYPFVSSLPDTCQNCMTEMKLQIASHLRYLAQSL